MTRPASYHGNNTGDVARESEFVLQNLSEIGEWPQCDVIEGTGIQRLHQGNEAELVKQAPGQWGCH